MIVNPKRVFLSLPKDYFDLVEDEQQAICLQMANALMAGLVGPDRLPSETRNAQES